MLCVALIDAERAFCDKFLVSRLWFTMILCCRGLPSSALHTPTSSRYLRTVVLGLLHVGMLCYTYYAVVKVLKRYIKCDWMAIDSQLLNNYPTNSKAILNIVFASLFYIIISKPIAHLSDKTRRKKFWIKDRLLKLSADLAFWLTRTKCMQNKNWLKLVESPFRGKLYLKFTKILIQIRLVQEISDSAQLSRSKKGSTNSLTFWSYFVWFCRLDRILVLI